MKITAILASLAVVATGAAAQVEEAAFNLGHYIKHNVIGISEEEAFKLGHYIAHNVIGISEEEQNMSLAEMAKRYNKVKKFIPAEEEDLKVKDLIHKVIGFDEEDLKVKDLIHKVIGLEEEQNMSLLEMAKRYNKVKKFIPAEEENMSLAEMAKRYNKVKKFIPAEEEEAFNVKDLAKHIAKEIGEEENLKVKDLIHKVIGLEEEQNMSLLEMAKRYNKVKKFIPAEEENMSLIEMAKRYNKVKKFIPAEEEDLKVKDLIHKVIGLEEEEAFNLKHYISHNVIGINEEEAMSLIEMAKRYNKVKKFIPAEEENTNIRRPILPAEEENMSLIEMAKRYNKVKKFIPAEEQNMSLKTMFNRYNKVKKFIPPMEEQAISLNLNHVANNINREEEDLKVKDLIHKVIGLEEEEAFSLKHYIAHNVIGITEEEEQNMSLLEMAKRYNKVKKFIPAEEEEAFRIVKTIPIRNQ